MDRYVQRYSVNVLVGNWVEEICLKSEKTSALLAKRDQRVLEKQKSQEMHGSLLEPVVLNVTDGALRYGENLQIACPDISFPGWSTSGLTLSYSMDDRHSQLGANSTMTASPFIKPRVRNCFKIFRIGHNCEEGEPVKFGDVFVISPCVSSQHFVTATVPRLNADRGSSGHPPLKIVESRDSSCWWTVSYWNASLRAEVEGLPVENGIPVVLKHVATGLNLTVETNFQLPTFYGNEYEVSVHSYKQIGGYDKAHNIWQFITNSLTSDEKDEMIDRKYEKQ